MRSMSISWPLQGVVRRQLCLGRMLGRREKETVGSHENLWVKVYDGEGDDAKLIFEGTVRQWEIFRKSRRWDIISKAAAPQRTGED
jgi:hypothetical protein